MVEVSTMSVKTKENFRFFRKISFTEYMTLHTTRAGISPKSKSLLWVMKNNTYNDSIFIDDSSKFRVIYNKFYDQKAAVNKKLVVGSKWRLIINSKNVLAHPFYDAGYFVIEKVETYSVILVKV